MLPPWARVVLLLAMAAPSAAGAAAAFDLDTVAEKAHALAVDTWHEPKNQVPDWLLKLTYDQWRDIRFRPEGSLWRDRKGPFEMQFFHPGLFYNRTVAVNVIDGDKVRPVAFSPSKFDYGKNDFASRIPPDLGFAGFRIHYPIKTRDYHDEVIVFLGASYFRGVGRDQVFGLSARALAIDTAESAGEEFPYFKEFWLVTPARGATDLTLYALLDSPSAAGAYRFVITPGEQTTMRVDARLFLRREVRKLGIAPLTSMFYHGEDTTRAFEDFRPEVHDSDGLVVQFPSGEWLWRALDNPRTLQVSTFATENPRGFGLVQRDRDFDHYQDLETRSDHRPSAWVAPAGDWGPGRIEVVEIPTNGDDNDNVVAYWVPKHQPKVGAAMPFGYTLSWYGSDTVRPPGGRVTATRRDRGTNKDAYRLVIDFEGKRLSAIPAEKVVHGVVTVQGGEEAAQLLDQQVVKNTVTGGWRLTFQVRPKRRDPLEIRAFLDQDGEVLTETWSYAIVQ